MTIHKQLRPAGQLAEIAELFSRGRLHFTRMSTEKGMSRVSKGGPKVMGIAFALLFVSTLAQADSLPYEAAFNEYGYAYTQTATMVGNDTAVVWFVTPASGRFLIQVGNASNSEAVEHRAVLTDGTNTISTQQGFYPSFYVTVGENLAAWTGYIMYVYNVNAAGVQSCDAATTCDVTVLIEGANKAANRGRGPK